jgi:hypothetical protein
MGATQLYEVLQTVGAIMASVNTLLLIALLVTQHRHGRAQAHYLEVTRQYANLMAKAAQGTEKKVDDLVATGSVPFTVHKANAVLGRS